MPFLRERQREAEWMDRPDVDPAELGRALGFIRRVNRWFGYTRATLWHVRQFARGWRAGERVSVLDVATGSADIPLAVARWGERAGHDLRVTGLDAHERTLTVARELVAAAGPVGRRVSLVQGDALALPYADGAFDYVTTNMFLHHLDDGQAVAVLREMDRVASRGVIVADLLRSYRAYAWIKVFTALASPMVRHDAAVSVRQALNRGEILSLRDRAGLQYARYYRHFGHRFVLAGEKLDRSR